MAAQIEMQEKIKFWFLGHTAMKSLSDYRRALLTAYIIVACLITCFYYIILNLSRHQNTAVHFYYPFIAALLVSFWLNRQGRHWIAKTSLMVCANFVVFAFSSREPPVPSAFLFYITSSLVALAIFDISERRSAYFFVWLSCALYLLARFTTFTLVPYSPMDEQYLVRAYNNNFVMVYAVSVLIIYFLVNINHSVEESLQNREKQILEKNQILVKTNEELDRFIYSTSHDLRAPLNSVQGLINLSELSTDKEELTLYHKMMRERLYKLESVLNEIMHYSKNAKLDIEKKRINLHDYIRRAWSDVQYMEGAGRIQVRVNVPDMFTIVTDPMRLSIILNNLISNSFKYSDLTKPDSYIQINAAIHENILALEIEDNGEGIDENHQAKIFSMFYRATTRSTGSGLGLYLVKEAVEKLGGSIFVTSVRGTGSRFTVTLPLENDVQ